MNRIEKLYLHQANANATKPVTKTEIVYGTAKDHSHIFCTNSISVMKKDGKPADEILGLMNNLELDEKKMPVDCRVGGTVYLKQQLV